MLSAFGSSINDEFVPAIELVLKHFPESFIVECPPPAAIIRRLATRVQKPRFLYFQNCEPVRYDWLHLCPESGLDCPTVVSGSLPRFPEDAQRCRSIRSTA